MGRQGKLQQQESASTSSHHNRNQNKGNNTGKPTSSNNHNNRDSNTTITFKCQYDPSGVIILQFKSISLLQKSLRRPHITYEGAELRGPLKGVNFPVIHLIQWACDTGRENMTTEELSMISLIKLKNSKFIIDWHSIFEKNLQCPYLVAYLESDHSTFVHEWAHAVYYLNKDYRILVETQWSKLDKDTQNIIEKELEFRNYKKEVYLDEFQAYVIEGPNELGKKIGSQLKDPHKLLNNLIGKIPSCI